MIAIRSHNPSFRPSADDYLPPSNIEAEEAILGGILLDSEFMGTASQRLAPEHFYNSTNREVYLACLALHKQGKRPDMLKVTDYLLERNKLLDIGVQTTIARLVNRCVSTVNGNELVTLVIEKYTRRRLQSLGEEIRYLAVSGEYEYDELMAILTKKTSEIILNPGNLIREQEQQAKHKKILDQLTEIFTTIPNPSFRFFKLKELAQCYGYSTSFLEQLYLKSLTGECSKLLTYEELKELGGAEVREWLLQGLVPKASTILLTADGGVGKTKLVYRIAKYLIEGKDFGDFTATGKRKILYYQGDESPGDMVQALGQMGYNDPAINKNVKVRFGWSCENMPTLIEDIQNFKPDFVMIDSLSTANKFSIYKENDMEYCRPLLEIAGLATKHGVTFLIVHHTNKDGGVRGSTSIRNAVSEVWNLRGDTSQQALPNDRILEIDKSRSRSCKVKYRLFFDDESLNFEYIGQDNEDKTEAPFKASILEFLKESPNVRFTSEEIVAQIGGSSSYARKILGRMGRDGLVTKIANSGTANLYYLANDCITRLAHPEDHPQKTAESPTTTSHSPSVSFDAVPSDAEHLEQPHNPLTAGNTAEPVTGDPHFEQNSLSPQESGNSCENVSQWITLAQDPDGDDDTGVGYGGVTSGATGGVTGGETVVIDNAPLQSVTQEITNKHPSFNKNKSQKLRIKAITGIWNTKYSFEDENIHLMLTTPQGLKLTVNDFYEGWDSELTLESFKSVVLAEIYRLELREMLTDRTFTVKRSKYNKDEGYIPVEVPDCKLVGVPSSAGRPFVFQLPKGDNFPVYKVEDFELNDFQEAVAPNNPQLPL